MRRLSRHKPRRHRLRTIAACAILQVGTVIGVPMRPEQVQDLMRAMNMSKLAQTNPEESQAGETPRAVNRESPIAALDYS